MALLLSACGGGTDDARASAQPDSPTSSATSPGAASPSTEALLAQGAKLNAETLSEAKSEVDAAEQAGMQTDLDLLAPGQLASKSAYASGDVRQKASDALVPVWRFYNGATGAHFFTRDATERASVIATLSPPKGTYQDEGEAFKVASAYSPGLSPVYRFFNKLTGVHFYTISDTERALIETTLPQFTNEGIAYYASKVAGAGMTPFYRFYVSAKGFHFYTASQTERDNITATLSAIYQYEGVGYWVLASDWVPEPEPAALIPHSGKADTQCVASDSLGNARSCSDTKAVALNPQQDGHRVAINPMSYSTIGAFPLTSCVKDNLTGLIWEGKTDDDGLRRASRQFTNRGNDKDDDTSSYVTYVNGLNLCGYSDWRVPTLKELMGIMNYGKYTPTIDSTWFPNTNDYTYWASDKLGSDTRYTATVTYNGGSSGVAYSVDQRVRLVRGYGHTTQRYSYDSVAYGADAANNVVIDGWTGLRWRRCEQGRTWTGSTCTGTGSTFFQYGALEHARDQSGWRLPNVKELASLLDLSVSSGATIDPTAFPGAVADDVWSSTPRTSTSGQHYVGFNSGRVYHTSAYSTSSSNLRLTRLVQLTQ